MRRQATLSIGPEAARLVVFEKGRVASWSSLELNPALDVGSPEEAGQQIRSLIRSQGIKSCHIIVDLYHPSLLIRNLQLPRMAQRYIRPVIASELKETIPFALEEIELFWQASANGRGWKVLALGIPSDILERHVQVLRSAGLRAAAFYPRSLALIQAAREKDAVLVDLGLDRTDIILAVQGLPRLVYRSTIHMDDGDRPEALAALSAEIGRVMEFGKSCDPKERDRVVIPIGPLASETLVARLAEACPWEVKPFQPQMECPSNFPAREYAANLGLAMAVQRRSGAGPALTSINVLPARYRPTPFPWKAAITFVLLLAIAAAAPYLIQRVETKTALVSSLSQRAASLQEQMSQERLRLQEVGKIQADIQAAQALTQKLESQLGGLAASRDALIQRLQAATGGAIPEGVALLSAAHATGNMSLHLQGRSYEEALQYTSLLRGSGLFQEVSLTEIQVGTEGVTFRVMATYPKDSVSTKP